MLAGRDGIILLANIESACQSAFERSSLHNPRVTMESSDRKLTHQLSNGDLHHVNHKDMNESVDKHPELTEVIHNFKDHETTHRQCQRTVSESAESHLYCGLRYEFLKPALVMSAWFFCSFVTIMLNKYILTSLDADPGVLGEFQIVMTTVFGFIAMYMPCEILQKRSKTKPNENLSRIYFFRSMLILGILRFGSVVSSVVALKSVAISFSETIKSSAPLFTVIIAYMLLGEYSGIYVNLSLLPIMFGLAICTSFELSFALLGFSAALMNNILDCIQNVYSKKLLIGDQNYSPMELQFYTSIAATVVQLPFWLFFMDIGNKMVQINQYLVGILLFNSVLFYFQSFTAYLLMSLISPITFSVASTAKRAVLIWFSILVFGNSVTLLSAIGTLLVVIGVFLYHRARHKESAERLRLLAEKEMRELNI